MLKSFVGNAAAEFDVDHIDEAVWKQLAEKMTYIQGDLTKPELYEKLRGVLDKAGEGARHPGQCHLLSRGRGSASSAPWWSSSARRSSPIRTRTRTASLDSGAAWSSRSRSAIAWNSARALNASILRTLHEDQIFRIDHFLGKDTVQSITAFRFANGLFEPIWNRDRIDHVQITAAETVGVERRGKFYEVTGALRDMVPNHVFSLLSLVAMEPPSASTTPRSAPRRPMSSPRCRRSSRQQAVRGQYGAGTVLGKNVKAYRQEPDVAPDSNVETYVAMRLEIDNWRWAGVPFYIRTGKHLKQRNTEIAIRFKQAPYAAFQDTPVDTLRPNWLVLRISPDEGISLQFEVKRPGPVVDLAAVKMDFRYDDWFPKEPNVGYETLLYDVMIGDPTLFMRADMVEHAWRVVQPVLDAWAKDGATDLPIYPAGSSGPSEADELLARDGRRWRSVDGDDDGQSS